MRCLKLPLTLALGLAGALLVASEARATVVLQFSDYTNMVNPSVPPADQPFLVSFTADNSGHLTISVVNETSGTYLSQISDIYFNTHSNPNISVTFNAADSMDSLPANWTLSTGGITADHTGTWDYDVGGQGDNSVAARYFSPSVVLSYSGGSATDMETAIADSFSTGNASYLGAMKVYVGYPTNINTGWVASRTLVQPIPEPRSAVLGLVGISGLGVAGLWRRFRPGRPCPI